MTGDHLPIWGLRYPGGVCLARAILMASAPYLVRFGYWTDRRNTAARPRGPPGPAISGGTHRFRLHHSTAVPSSLSGYEKNTRPDVREMSTPATIDFLPGEDARFRARRGT
ncbi:hypothetical protein Smic_42760 [Streptomyces microflavus]|uniref:Uncharacterized protein n=1 Tax=Streptomyces microflavus TaxID=1919 RepID=A0A7J0CT62_STRMI|nr:hypothetical protein Smic_42760 [Streptomyces microflavus]